MQNGRLEALAPKAEHEESHRLLREAVTAMGAARLALEAVATMHLRRGRRRAYWRAIAADSAAFARLLALHEASLAGQVPRS